MCAVLQVRPQLHFYLRLCCVRSALRVSFAQSIETDMHCAVVCVSLCVMLQV
jgi:hypothetical protein